MGGFSPRQTLELYRKLQVMQTRIVLKKVLPLPETSYYAPRNRYRADSLIAYLKGLAGSDTVVVGLTNVDISTTKGTYRDWGIMGLGYTPGSSCIVSTFRVQKDNASAQLYKLVLHELAHTQGLPHCPVKTCYMRDAEGGNPLNEEKAFCEKCKAFLRSKGWKL